MKRNCNLELQLVTPSVFFHSSDYNGRYHHSMLEMESHESPNKKQKLTIFYNGEVASYDATELQAKAIISLASREIDDKLKKNSSGSSTPTSPDYCPATGLSMKRSLQRFLEKRRTRAQSPSPYTFTRYQ